MSVTKITTPLPAAVQGKDMIAALQDHSKMIKALCPAVIKYELESGTQNKVATYSVTDRKPIGQTTYKLRLTNVPGGVDSFVIAKPPVGTLTVAGKWRVRHAQLIEEVEIDGNFMVKRMAKGNVEKTHPEQHVKLIQMARG